ncbi:MAG: MmcQ/YjbR family DNA-binding protein [Acidimicrobiia bacterium]|nr:MmcQ/YjbR family DNA-binding protein [Acidimicrobiia bacterium]
MYADDDPYLSELRERALAFPEAVEVEAWGRPTFRAGKIFALFSGTEDRPYGVIFKPDADDRHALLEDDRFYSPPYYGPGGWLTLDFEAASVDWDEVGELLDASYRQIALKRQLKALDTEKP